MLSITVDTLVDENNGVGVGAGTSLHEAILAAAPGDTIDFSVTGTINLVSLLPAINKNLTIAGPGRDLLTIVGSGFSIGDNKSQVLLDVFISGLTITGSHPTFGSGGGIYTTENLTVSDCAITNCSTTNGSDGGGGIYSFAGQQATPNTLTVRNTILSGNTALNTEGAAIRKRYGTLVVDGCTITGNTAYWAGAGISVADGTVQAHIMNSVISDNHVTNTTNNGGYGGGIFIYNGGLDISNSVISGNTAPSGGGINASQSQLSVTDSTISGNTAIGATLKAGDGGGIWAPNLHASILRSTIDGNTAALHSTIDGDFTTPGRGGGIYAVYMSAVDSTISGNSAGIGGGLYSGGATIRNCTFSGNSAAVDGGAIAGPLRGGLGSKISTTTVTANTSPAPSSGKTPGAIRIPATITSSIIAGNINNDWGSSVSSGGYNIVGTGPVGNFGAASDQKGVTNPMLGPLADNGGPTKTHMPLSGSPVINAGNPAFNPANPDGLSTTNDATPYDQRGATLGRIYGGRIDVGALERQPIPSVIVGDFNQDGTVGTVDYLIWRMAIGTTIAPFTGADASGNGIIDHADYAIWRAHYGFVIPIIESAGAGSSQSLLVPAAAETAESLSAPSFVQATVGTSLASKPVRPALAAKFPIDAATLNLIALRAPSETGLKSTRPLDHSNSQTNDPDSDHCQALDAAFATRVAGFAKIRT